MFFHTFCFAGLLVIVQRADSAGDDRLPCVEMDTVSSVSTVSLLVPLSRCSLALRGQAFYTSVSITEGAGAV